MSGRDLPWGANLLRWRAISYYLDPMPGEAVESVAARRWSHVGALDGLRACAVLFVIGFHTGISWLGGGYYGVDVFFALSGFLITSLLVAEWDQRGTLSLAGFWARRARRLLPALFLMLAAVGIGAALWPGVLGSPQLVGDTAATVGYFANWHFIYAGSGYFAQLNTGSALTHTWTLSIEEQFYLLWPIVLLAVLRRPRRVRRGAPDGAAAAVFDPAAHRRRRLRILLLLTTSGAVASAAAMAVLAPVGNPDPVRAYFGTDTQAQCLLIGAALSALIALRRDEPGTGLRRVLGVSGVLGAAGLVLMCSRVPSSSALAFHGGFALVALSSAAVIGAVFTNSRHPLTRLLEWGPARYVGRISYGMYLWYLPVLMVMTPGRMGASGYALAGERLGVIVAIASFSYRFIETPIRRGALAGWRARIAAPTGAALTIVAALMAAVFAPVQATLTSAPAAAAVGVHSAGGPPVRILLIGDSMAGSLGVGLGSVAPYYGATVINEGSPACSLSMDQMVKILWFTDPPGPPCRNDDPAALIDQFRSWIHTYNPDVVVYLARSDTLNQELHGQWTNLGNPTFDAWYTGRLNQAVAVLSSEGAHVVFLTTPYYDPGGQGDGDGFPENQPARVVVDNDILTRVADAHASVASVINLNGMISPEHKFAQDIDGVALRCTDGVHFTIPGGQWLGAQLLPRLVALGHTHLQTALEHWRTPVPTQAPPSWYSELPCAQ